jgi:hypothetical protein
MDARPTPEPTDSMTTSNSGEIGTSAAVEPSWALLIGGVSGAATFLLCALLFGARTAIAIAAVSMIVALVRRDRAAAVTFAVSAALATIGLLPSTAALIAAALVFGIALALFARARMRDGVAVANDPMANA